MKIRTVKDLLKQLQDYDPEMEIYTYTDEGMVNENVHCEFQYIAPSDLGYKVDEYNIHRCFENVPCSTYNKKVLVVG